MSYNSRSVASVAPDIARRLAYVGGYDGDSTYNLASVDSSGRIATASYVWNASTLAWEAQTQTTVTVDELSVTGVAISNFPSAYTVTGGAAQAADVKVTLDGESVGVILEGAVAELRVKPSSPESFVSGTVTLTVANTAYKVPTVPEYYMTTIILYNGSDTDMYVGASSVTTSNGIPLPVGATMSVGCGGGDTGGGIYVVCGSAGKVVRYLEQYWYTE